MPGNISVARYGPYDILPNLFVIEMTENGKRSYREGRKFKRGKYWHISYYYRGKEQRESTKSGSEVVADRLLKRRMAEVITGVYNVSRKWSFQDMIEDVRRDYRINNKVSARTLEIHINHLKEEFDGALAMEIDATRVREYQGKRLKERASPASINREVSVLTRGLSLAYESRKISFRPKLSKLDGERIREGYIEHADFLRVLFYLPRDLQNFVHFLYLTGWRSGVVKGLEWKDVDLKNEVIIIAMGQRVVRQRENKRKPVVLPLSGTLRDIIYYQHSIRRIDCPYVFYREGQRGAYPINRIDREWIEACARVGVRGLVMHDLRGICATNLEDAGVSRSVIKDRAGWCTDSIFYRYRRRRDRDQARANEALENFLEKNTDKRRPVVSLLEEKKRAGGSGGGIE